MPWRISVHAGLLTLTSDLRAARGALAVKQIYARARLSQCETEALRLLGDGKTIAEIAKKLKISMKTVQEYCWRLKKKLRAANRNRLIRIAVLWRSGVAEIVVRSVRGE